MDFVHPVEAIVPGVQGHVLAVLAETTADLNLGTIARLSGVSQAQASRVLPGLVELGLVERHEVPPSSLFRLVHDHVAAAPVLSLARSRDAILERMTRVSSGLAVVPVSVILFGSFARGEAEVHSDIDAVLVHPPHTDESDQAWSDSLEHWKEAIGRASGNRVETLEVGADEIAALLRSNRSLWQDIRRDGLVVYGLSIDQLTKSDDG